MKLSVIMLCILTLQSIYSEEGIYFEPSNPTIEVAKEISVRLRIARNLYSQYELDSETIQAYTEENTEKDNPLPLFEASILVVEDNEDYFIFERKYRFYKPGEFKVHAITGKFTRYNKQIENFTSPDLTIVVSSTLQATESEPEMYDVLNLKFSFRRLILLFLIFIALGLTIFAFRDKLKAYFRQLRNVNGKKELVLTKKQKLDLFIDQVAKLQSEYTPESVLESVLLLEALFLEYLSDSFKMHADAQTLSRVLPEIKSREFKTTADFDENLQILFERWTMIKYAKNETSINDFLAQCDQCLSLARKTYSIIL